MKRLAAALLSAPVGLALVAAAAPADEVRVELRWIDSDNPAAEGVGTATLRAAPGDSVRLGLFVDLPSSADTLAIYGLSLRFDTEQRDALDFGPIDSGSSAPGEPSIVELDFPGCVGDPPFCNLTAGVSAFTDSSTSEVGEVLTFEGNAREEDPGLQGPGVYPIGEVTFLATANLGVAGATLVPGFFNPAADNLSNGDFYPVENPVFLPARIELLPEPRAAALGLAAALALGAVLRVRARPARGGKAVH